MKNTEIVTGIYIYSGMIRVKPGKSSTTAKTIVFADGVSQARASLSVMYGDDAVVSVTKVSETDLQEAVPNRTFTKPVPRILPTDYNHALAQKALLNQMKRNA